MAYFTHIFQNHFTSTGMIISFTHMIAPLPVEEHWSVIYMIVWRNNDTVYPKKYAHGFVVLCFVVVMQSFIMNSHEVFIHIHQGCFAGTGAIVRLPQCQWSKPDGYGKISQCITTTKHSKAKTVCIFLGIYCITKTKRTMFKSVGYNSYLRKMLYMPFICLHYLIQLNLFITHGFFSKPSEKTVHPSPVRVKLSVNFVNLWFDVHHIIYNIYKNDNI